MLHPVRLRFFSVSGSILMIYENYEFPIPSGCELMKVNRGYYVYLRLKAEDKPKKICIGRCKFAADQTKTLIPNTNYFRHFNRPLPQRTSVRVSGRTRKCTASAAEVPVGRTALHLACQKAAAELHLSSKLHQLIGDSKASAVIEAAVQASVGLSLVSGSTPVVPSVSLLWSLTPAVARQLFSVEANHRRKAAVCQVTLPISGTSLNFYLAADSAQPLGFASDNNSTAGDEDNPLAPPTDNTVTVLDPIYQPLNKVSVLLPENGLLLIPLSQLDASMKACLQDFRARLNNLRLVQLETSAAYPFTFQGVRGKLLILFNREADSLQSAALTSLLVKTEAESRLRHADPSEISPHFGPFFEAAVLEASGKTVFQRREKAVEEAFLTCGCSLFFTTDNSLSPTQCRHLCEGFRSVRRTAGQWIPELLDLPTSCLPSLEYGFMLILHLALVFRWYCTTRISAWLQENRCTLCDALIELSRIRLLHQENQWVVFEPITPAVRTLLEQLQLPVQFAAPTENAFKQQPT